MYYHQNQKVQIDFLELGRIVQEGTMRWEYRYISMRRKVCVWKMSGLGNIFVVPRFFRDDEMILQSFISNLYLDYSSRIEISSHSRVVSIALMNILLTSSCCFVHSLVSQRQDSVEKGQPCDGTEDDVILFCIICIILIFLICSIPYQRQIFRKHKRR